MNFIRNKYCLLSLVSFSIFFPAGAKAVSITPAYSSELQIDKIGDISHITQMVFGPDQRLYAITDNQGVLSFAYNPTTGVLSDEKVAADISGLGIAFQGNTMYVSSFDKIVRLTDNNNNGLYGEPGETNVVLVDGLPTGDHEVDQLQIQGNSLYVGIGDRTIDGTNKIFNNPDTLGETSYGGTISWIQDLSAVPSTPNAAQLIDNNGNLLSNLEFLTNATPYTSTDPTKLVVYASGLRNPFGLAFDSSGQLWTSNNYNRALSLGNGTSIANPNDALDNNLEKDVYDQLFKVSYKANFGYPNPNWQNNPSALAAGFFNPNNLVKSTTFDNLYTNSFTPYDPKNPNGLGPSASADGFDFYTGNVLPSEFQNMIFLTRYNSGPVTQPNGQYSLSYGDVVLINPTTGNVTQLAEGFVNPLAVLSDPDGLIVADYHGGVYQISATATVVSEPSNTIGLIMLLGIGQRLRNKKKVSPEIINHK